MDANTIRSRAIFMRTVFDNIKYNDWRFFLYIPTGDPEKDAQLGDKPYVQVDVDGVDNVTGEPLRWKGRKWQLSFHMTETELVRTAHMAVKQAVMHELDEQFLYMGVTPFNPHFDVGELVKLAKTTKLDSR